MTTGYVLGLSEPDTGSTPPGSGSWSRALLGTPDGMRGRVRVNDDRPIIASVQPYARGEAACRIPAELVTQPTDAGHVCIVCRHRRAWPDICPCCVDSERYMTEWPRCPACYSLARRSSALDWPDFYRSHDVRYVGWSRRPERERDRWSVAERAAIPDLREPRTGAYRPRA